MDEPPPPERHAERLQALDERIEKLKARKRPKDEPKGMTHSQGEMAWRMVIELVAGLAIGFGIGYGLDVLLGTRPIMLVIFILLGFAAGIRTMMRTAKEVQDAATRPDAEGDEGG